MAGPAGKLPLLFGLLLMAVVAGFLVGLVLLDSPTFERQFRNGINATRNATAERQRAVTSTSAPRVSDDSIPHIIHQTWDAPRIPKFFAENIQSWVKKHPQWEYWFWNANDIRFLVSRCFPDEYLKLYTNYMHVVNRADSFRYFALYIFGGLYADLDMIALKSHESLIDSQPCVVTQETYEHSVVLYNNVQQPNLVNAYIACRPHHPFMRLMVEELPAYANIRDDLRKTGPFFENNVHSKYIRVRAENGNWTGPVNEVHVLEPKWVMPTFDRGQVNFLKRKCRIPPRHVLPFYSQVCKDFLQTRMRNNTPGPEALADHRWIHTYLNERKWKKIQEQVTIDELVPKRVNVSERIRQACPSKRGDTW